MQTDALRGDTVGKMAYSQFLNDPKWPPLELRRTCHRIDVFHESFHGRNTISIPAHLKVPANYN